MKKIVSKFGGTSMGDATCMLRSAEVAKNQNSCLLVVSATSGTTNQLIKISNLAEKSTWESTFEEISVCKQKHTSIAQELNSSDQTLNKLNELFFELESLAKGISLMKDCSTRALDNMVSLGERMSSLLFVEAVKKHNHDSTIILLDARDVVITDNQFGKAKPITELIKEKAKDFILKKLDSKTIFVTQGFIGKTCEGHTTTLGRGGSDYSAAIFAEAINADVVEIWTDVDGIYTTDPRQVLTAKSIETISFKEASELATFGAKVLHPATLIPAMRNNIPTFVGNSFDAKQKGTWIFKNVESAPLVRAMAVRKNQVLVTLSTPDMLHTHGFLFQIFKVLNDYKISIDAITTSEISVAFTLDDATLLNKELISDLGKFAEVSVEEHLSLISLIGNNINHTPGLAEKIFSSIKDINVRMICLGASKHNFCFLVNEDHAKSALQKLHDRFIDT